MQIAQLTSTAASNNLSRRLELPDVKIGVRAVKVRAITARPLAAEMRRLTLADQAKDEFLAVLSHELRSPLAAIQNAIRVLRSPRGSDAAIQAGMHELIDRQVRQMSLLATGLLDVGRITRGQLLLQHARIDLVTVLSNAMETVQADISRQDQVLTTSWPHANVWVSADPSRLEQVFVNLLTNASKYTDRGGQISISLQALNGYAVVRVQDSGIGIAAHILPNIFDLFMQVSAKPTRSGSGVGVGLALVRKIVELHEGTVTALSAGLGQGSEFVVRLRTQV